MKIRLVTVGKTSDPHWRELAREYSGRLARFAPLEQVEVREGPENDPVRRLQGEAQRIRRALVSGGRIVLSDREGRAYSSEELSRLIGAERLAGTRSLSLVIGSAFGLDASLKAEIPDRASLGPMTFPHEAAKVLWLEQLYRAFSILENRPYHH